MAKLIAQTYGQALLELATEENKVDELMEEVTALRQIFADNSELMDFMKHPQISKEEKRELLETALKDRVSNDLVGFVLLIAEKDRFSAVMSVFDYFIDEVNRIKKIGKAHVATPIELSDSQKEKVIKKLLDTTDYETMEIEYEIDPSLIGGMVIRIRDRVVDSSIRTRIYEMKKDLKQIQLQN